MRLQQYLTENMTRKDLKSLEIVLDRLFKTLNIDIEFTNHFFKRINDRRNKKPITFEELQDFYNKTYKKYSRMLTHLPDNTEAVLHDIQSDLNIPFHLKIDNKRHMIDLIGKTVMRKKNFKTSNRKYEL